MLERIGTLFLLVLYREMRVNIKFIVQVLDEHSIQPHPFHAQHTAIFTLH